MLHSNVTLYQGVTIGKRVVIHSGTVIGADGFGYVFDGKQQVKVPQTGSVEIHDDVEIGANSCVDRATFGSTVIERGAKLDNHVHVAHNCRIGENTVIVGCVGLSGSVTIGKNCILAGQCGTVDHINIGDNVRVMARAVVTKDIPSGSVVSGRYGRSHQQELKQEALLRRLPEIYRDWKERRKG
jgi:UDP-3-O-[3-hydroxymyristoyl] glucosamine N-acyltransferase